jgi:hypothetical protein
LFYFSFTAKEKEMEWKKFVTFVKLNLGIKIENKEEQDEWAAFADQADEAIFLEAVQPLVDNYADALNNRQPVKSPLLSQIAAVYRRAEKQKRDSAMLDRFGNCEHCGGSGQLYVLWDSAKGKTINVRQPFEWTKQSFDIRLAPCGCPKGRQQAPNAPKEWFDNNIFCGFKLNDREKLEKMCYINARKPEKGE